MAATRYAKKQEAYFPRRIPLRKIIHPQCAVDPAKRAAALEVTMLAIEELHRRASGCGDSMAGSSTVCGRRFDKIAVAHPQVRAR
jgi:hypothetical protein